MTAWRPDWDKLIAEAPVLRLEEPKGFVYLVADAHLGDSRSPVPDFLAMLHHLEDPALVVLLGDLFKVWLALPKFWDTQVRLLLEGLQQLRARGIPLWFVVGNRDFFLPRRPALLQSSGLPFDAVIPEAALLEWNGRRYGLTHGDLANRDDTQYLRWRRLSRSRPFEALFRAMPGPLARQLALHLETVLANTNQDIKILYPAEELDAFAHDLLHHPRKLDAAFIGHFHREETITSPGHPGALRIVPDWFSTRKIMRLYPSGTVETLKL